MSSAPITIQSYRDLIAWQKSFELVLDLYRCTQDFPKPETYGLVAQISRAAVSIPSNIAEGHARLSTAEFRQFLGHALGSLMEIETQILLAATLDYLHADNSNRLLQQTSEVGKILNGLLRSLSNQRWSTGP